MEQVFWPLEKKKSLNCKPPVKSTAAKLSWCESNKGRQIVRQECGDWNEGGVLPLTGTNTFHHL